MGFSLIFMGLDGDRARDADRDGLRRFLNERGLRAPDGPQADQLVDAAGDALAFDGDWSDLHIDPLDHPKPLSGGVWHAGLSAQECDFVYDLCVAAGWLIVNPQGEPDMIVPGGTHTAEQLSPLTDVGESVAFVGSGAELRLILTRGFRAFLAYRDQVLGREHRDDAR